MKKNTKSPMSGKQAIAVGAGLAAVAAAATGVYMMTGKHAKNRKKVTKWAGDLQQDVVKELGKAGKASKQTYNKIIDAAAKNYKGMKNVSGPELAAVASDLKNSWDAIQAEISNAQKTVRRVVPKAVKSVAKKVGVKTAKKAASKAVAKKAAPQKKAAPKRRR